MKAWEKAQQIFREARPVVRSEEEQTWTDNVDVSQFYDDNLSLDWGSNVPGSGAPEKITIECAEENSEILFSHLIVMRRNIYN